MTDDYAQVSQRVYEVLTAAIKNKCRSNYALHELKENNSLLTGWYYNDNFEPIGIEIVGIVPTSPIIFYDN